VSDEIDRQLFFASTIISVGNGKTPPSRRPNDLMRPLPKKLLQIFNLARFKRTVSKELLHSNWIRNLSSINTTTPPPPHAMPIWKVGTEKKCNLT
jgi:hypothetical protein